MPRDLPLFVIAPPDRSHRHAIELTAAAAQLGRRVIAVAHEDATEVRQYASDVLPICGQTREAFYPLLCYQFAPIVASFVAEKLGMALMQSNPRDFVQLVDGSTVDSGTHPTRRQT